MSLKVEAEIEAFQRKLLDERLSQCTETQVAFFHKLYPNGVPKKNLISAIDLCDRTIKKNQDDPSRLENL